MDKLRPSLCLFFLLFLPSALAPLPLLLPEEIRIYSVSRQLYTSLYGAPQLVRRPTEQYLHLRGAHPHLETQALEHAQMPGNGPFFPEQTPGALYVSTQVQSDSLLGQTWNLKMQEGGPMTRMDAHLFWRIDKRGRPKLLRVDAYPTGAQPQEAMSMQDAINLARSGNRDCFGCF